MTFTVAEVDAIVAEVLRRLAGAGWHPPASSDTDGAVLRIDRGVISLSDIDGRLAGVRVLSVPPRAIVTPLVRDYLKDNNVTLRRQSGEEA